MPCWVGSCQSRGGEETDAGLAARTATETKTQLGLQLLLKWNMPLA